MSEKKTILNYLNRSTCDEQTHYFRDLLERAVRVALNKNGADLDQYVQANLNRFWNIVKQQQQLDQDRGLVPLFYIEDEYAKKVSWFVRNPDLRIKRKKHLLKARPLILSAIDALTSRQYEALGCEVASLLGANKLRLTKSGNEAGIDFIATINFSQDAHYFFGINGPLRLIGQCKKYKDPVQVSAIKEFNSTLDDVYSLTQKMRTILPDWFVTSKGPIIGWFIAHDGFQSGAITRARNYGIIISDTRDIAEIIALSKKFEPLLPEAQRANALRIKLLNILNDPRLNMDLQ